jgi:hypothetical protein
VWVGLHGRYVILSKNILYIVLSMKHFSDFEFIWSKEAGEMPSPPLVSHNRQIYNLFCDIQDIICAKKHWPRRILSIFWKKKCSHWERKLLSAFLYVNGLNPIVFSTMGHT